MVCISCGAFISVLGLIVLGPLICERILCCITTKSKKPSGWCHQATHLTQCFVLYCLSNLVLYFIMNYIFKLNTVHRFIFSCGFLIVSFKSFIFYFCFNILIVILCVNLNRSVIVHNANVKSIQLFIDINLFVFVSLFYIYISFVSEPMICLSLLNFIGAAIILRLLGVCAHHFCLHNRCLCGKKLVGNDSSEIKKPQSS